MMTKQFITKCEKGHDIDLGFIGGATVFTRDFEGKSWNSCSDHSMIQKDIMIGKTCMKCAHLYTEAI